MITAPDFNKKQIVFVLFNEGEKLSFSNDNLVIRQADGKIKFQVTCYRLFIVYAIGHCSITSALIQKSKKFGFNIALMTPGFKLYAIIGAEKDGNTMLKKAQYMYNDIDIAKWITINKINNQIEVLKQVRNKNDSIKDALPKLNQYKTNALQAKNLNELMAYEGLSSKLYFKNHFNNVLWKGRQPRLKNDYLNSVLDIGYTLLFAFIEAILSSFGFDLYCGVMHKQFYMRKSLVCDIVEPFRCLIDIQVKKSINLKQMKEDDFVIINGQYRLKWECSAAYVKFLMHPIIEYKDDIFTYIQEYYRAFMKNLPIDQYPFFEV